MHQIILESHSLNSWSVILPYPCYLSVCVYWQNECFLFCQTLFLSLLENSSMSCISRKYAAAAWIYSVYFADSLGPKLDCLCLVYRQEPVFPIFKSIKILLWGCHIKSISCPFKSCVRLSLVADLQELQRCWRKMLSCLKWKNEIKQRVAKMWPEWNYRNEGETWEVGRSKRGKRITRTHSKCQCHWGRGRVLAGEDRDQSARAGAGGNHTQRKDVGED